MKSVLITHLAGRGLAAHAVIAAPPEGIAGNAATSVIIDEAGDFGRAAAAADAAVERAVYFDLLGYPDTSQGLSDFVRDSVADDILLHGCKGGPSGILQHVGPHIDSVKVDPVGLNSRQARRAAEREARKSLDRRTRSVAKKVGITGKMLKRAGRRLDAELSGRATAGQVVPS